MTSLAKNNTAHTERQQRTPSEELPSLAQVRSLFPALIVEHKVSERIGSWLQERHQLAIHFEGGVRELLKAVAEVDRSFIREVAPVLKEHKQALHLTEAYRIAEAADSALRHSRAKTVEEDHLPRLRTLAEQVIDIWEEIGECRGRSNNLTRELTLRNRSLAIEQEVVKEIELITPASGDSERALAHRAQLLEAVETIKRQAEMLGERRYLEADRNASALQLAIRAAGINTAQIFQTLEPLNREEAERCFRVFREKYGQDFTEARDRAYGTGITKYLSFLRPNAIREVLSEQFGIGVGIFERIRFFTRAQWRDRGSSLAEVWKSIVEKIRTPQQSRMEHLLAGEKIKAASDAIFVATWDKPLILGNYKKKSVEEIAGILDRFTLPERQELTRDFHERYGSKFNGQPLSEIFRSTFVTTKGKPLSLWLKRTSENLDGEYLCAKLSGDEPRALAYRLAATLQKKGKDSGEILLRIADKDDATVASVRNQLAKIPGISLTDFRRQFKDRPLADLAGALFQETQPDRLTVEAARLRASLCGHSREFPEAVLYRHSDDEDDKIIQRYNEMYRRNFLKDYQRHGGKDVLQVLHSYRSRGELIACEEARDCLSGLGVDTESLRAILSDRSAKQQERLKESYGRHFQRLISPYDLFSPEELSRMRERFLDNAPIAGRKPNLFQRMKAAITRPRDLEEDICAKLDGYDVLEMTSLLRGEPDKAKDLYTRFKERYAYEHNGEDLMSEERKKDRQRRLREFSPLRRAIRFMWDDREYVKDSERTALARGTRKMAGFCRSFFLYKKEELNPATPVRNAARAIAASPVRIPVAICRKIASIGKAIQPWDHPNVKVKERDCQAVEKYYRETIAPRLRAGEDPHRDEIRQFKQLIKIAGQSLDFHREVKRNYGNLLANLGEIAISPIATVGVAYFGLPYLPVAATVTAYALGIRCLIKMGVMRDGYGRKEAMKVDFPQAAISGVTLALGKIVSTARMLRYVGSLQKIGSTSMKLGAKTILKQMHKRKVIKQFFKPSESGHVRIQTERSKKELMDNYGKQLEQTRRRQLVTESNLRRLPPLIHTFKRLGQEIAS